jgi:hypothetical protein
VGIRIPEMATKAVRVIDDANAQNINLNVLRRIDPETEEVSLSETVVPEVGVAADCGSRSSLVGCRLWELEGTSAFMTLSRVHQAPSVMYVLYAWG